MMRAIKYAAVWIAFLVYHADTAGAHQCAKQSADLPSSLLDKSEQRIAAALVCLIAAAIACIFSLFAS